MDDKESRGWRWSSRKTGEVALRRENGLYLAEFHLSAKEVHGKLEKNQEKSAGVRATSQLSSGHEVTQITVTSRYWSATSTWGVQ